MAKQAMLDPKTGIPKSYNQLTKEFMLSFMEQNERVTAEDRIWFKELVREQLVEKESNLREGKVTGIGNISYVRQEFAKRFFREELIESRKKPSKRQKSWLERLDAL